MNSNDKVAAKGALVEIGVGIVSVIILLWVGRGLFSDQEESPLTQQSPTTQVVHEIANSEVTTTTHPYLHRTIAVRTNNIKNPVALISQEIFVNWISMYNIGTLLEYDDEEVERIEWADYSLDDDGNCICEVRISLTKNTGSMDLVDFVKIFDLEQRKSIKKIYSRSTPGYAEAQAKIIEQ